MAAMAAEAIQCPARQAEQPHLLRRWRIHRQPVGVVRVALRFAHHVRVAVLPHAALAQQPVGGQPGPRQHERRPPGVGGKHRGAGEAGDQLHQTSGDEVHGDGERWPADAEIEVPRHGDVVGERRILQMREPLRANAGDGELIVEPRRQLRAEIRADGLMQRREHLRQQEHHGHDGQRGDQIRARLHRAGERAHNHGERRRQQPAQHKQQPPRHGQRRVGARQDADELPLLAFPPAAGGLHGVAALA